LPQVFDLFVQAERALARSQGGLGIGLTLVRRLVEMHGGQVTARSAGQNRGSEFVIRLPVLHDARPAKRPAAATPKDGAPLRVLVVDDNADAADSLAMLLRTDGHKVEVAYDGAAALEAARAQQPEVVFLDIGLPILNGYEVAKRLHQRQDVPRPLVVALTGYGQEEDRRQAAAAGFDRYLVKPVDPTELTGLLAALANGAERRADSPVASSDP
jgi:two-component system CheB/CheR fusion protein